MKEKRRKLYVELPYEIGVSQSHFKLLEYNLYEDGEVISRFTSEKQPRDLTPNTKLKQFINALLEKDDLGTSDAEGDFIKYPKDKIITKITQVLGYLQTDIDTYHQNKDKIQEEQAKQKHTQELQQAKQGYDELCMILEENKVSFIDFVTLMALWLNGGETKNTLKGFLCHASTYLGIKPIWFLVLGPSGEGKSIIEESAFTLTPPSAFVNGRMTESALYRKSSANPTYLDCKIARMGDMGGDSDLEKYEGTLDKFKELTTEGVTEFELTGEAIDPVTGERKVINFKLYGFPSVSMTTVHSEKLDPQVMSRGVNVTPEATDEQVKLYKRYFQGKIKDYFEETIKHYIHLLHDYLTYIKLKYPNMEVINPYFDCVTDWLEGSEYFKRHLDIILLLIQTVTILNFNFRETITSEDGTKEYVIATPSDNKLICEFFDPGFGLSENAKITLNKLIDLFNKSENEGSPHLTLDSYEELANFEYSDYNNNHGRLDNKNTLFSVSTVKHKFSKVTSLKRFEVGDIFKHLVDMGYIVSMGKVYRSNNNVYRLNTIDKLDAGKIIFDDDVVKRYVEELAPVYGVCPHTLLKLTKIENQFTASPCSISDLEPPLWVVKSADSMPLSAYFTFEVPTSDRTVPLNAEEKKEAKK